MTLGLEHYKKKDWYSPTGLVSCARCPARYFFGSGCRLKAPRSHISLTFGRCMHRAIPVTLTAGVKEGFATFREEWNLAIADGTIVEGQVDDKRNPMRAGKMLEDLAGISGTYEILPSPPSELKGDVGPWEIPFALDIGEDRPLMGKVDGWCRHRGTGEYWGIEYKTTSSLGSWFFDSFRRSPQVSSYNLALSTLTDEKIKGVVLLGTQVAKIKVDSLASPITSTELEVEKFLKWTKRVAGTIQACEVAGDWPEEFAACSSYPYFYSPGGKCEFLDLCQSKDWTRLLDMYEVSDYQAFWFED